MLLHDQAHKTQVWMSPNGWKLSPPIFMTLLLLILVVIAAVFDPATISSTIAMTVAFSPIWLPFFLGTILLITWVHYIRYRFWFGRELSILEIQLPAEVSKSPLAVELFLSSIYNTGSETTFLNRLWRGGFRPIWSLEIASNEGQISFYIHGMKVWMPAVEARIYGQFPEAKIFEVDDYVSKVNFNLEEYDLWGGEYMKNDPQAQPFKTYVDFELDKNTDTPEIKVDPITNILEVMNNMGKDQYLWMQIILKAHSGAGFDWYGFYENVDTYVEDGRAKIQAIMQGAGKRSKAVQAELKEDGANAGSPTMSLTEGERDIIKGIEHSFTKNVFEVGLRILYIAKKEKFHGINGAFLFRIFQVFKSNLNGIGGKPGRGMIQFDYPWEDFRSIRENFIKRLMHFHYKYRAYFYVPYDQVPSMMTTEEIATLWHFPTSDVKTPGLNRVPSKSAGAPSNLPTLPQ